MSPQAAKIAAIIVLGVLASIIFAAALRRPPPPPPPTIEQRNACWLRPGSSGCASIIAQTGQPRDPICPLGGIDRGRFSDGRRCAISTACPPAARCGSMRSKGSDVLYYLGRSPEPAGPPPPRLLPESSLSGQGVLATSIAHTASGQPFDLPAFYPTQARSPGGAYCVKDPSQPGCPPTGNRALCCSRAPKGVCVDGCGPSVGCEGEAIPYSIWAQENCGLSELTGTVNIGQIDS